MCPSYRATGREQDSTRGRARLLQEMIAGSLSGDGWQSTEVRDALDLCLSCKGCLSECPTGVDMASYKSEFLYQHYRRRRRPRSHHSLGALPRWLRLSWRLAPMSNAMMRGCLVSSRTRMTRPSAMIGETPVPKSKMVVTQGIS